MDVYIVTYRNSWSRRLEINTACSSKEKANRYIDECVKGFQAEQREEERKQYEIIQLELDGHERYICR